MFAVSDNSTPIQSAARLSRLRRFFIALIPALTIAVWFTPDVAGEVDGNALEIEAQVDLLSADSSRSALVERRLWKVPLGQRFGAYLANFSLELKIKALDSIRTEISAFLATVGSRPDSRAKRFTIEHGLPAIISDIRGKAGAVYRLKLVPRRYVTVDLDACKYYHRDSASFKSDPTANFDLYFVPQSLGDFHWNKVKQLLENDYRPFKDAFDITMPGKIHYFLHPCQSPGLAWDTRFGYYIDPTRMQAHVIYNHQYMGATALVATLTQMLRVYGYAPPFLAEGISSYFYFHNYDAVNARRDGALVPLDSLLTTWGYYSADPTIASASAGSFCRFLADTRGIEKFRLWYKESDDLNIREKFVEIYQQTLAALEQDWLHYLDTVTLNKRDFIKRANLEGAVGAPRRALEVLQTALQWDTAMVDTLKTLEAMAPFYSELGEYDLALRTYKALYSRAPNNHPRKMFFLLRVGYVSMLKGEYDPAIESFEELQRLDSTRTAAARFNIARCLLAKGDTTQALERLEAMHKKKLEPLLGAEVTLALAFIYGQPGSAHNAEKAGQMFAEAFSLATFLVNNAPNEPLHRLRHGLASLGLQKYDFARQNLEVAKFLEFRPRYLGAELVALGNLEDLLGNRDSALTYYHQADSLDQSAYGRQSSRRYIEKPFSLDVALDSGDEER